MPDDQLGNEDCKLFGAITDNCPTHENLEQQYREGAGVWYADYVNRDHATQPVDDEGNPTKVKFIDARRDDEERDDGAPRAAVTEVVAIGGAGQIWPMKKMKTTAGFKLDQSKNTGWDVNLDGFPHIGLFPDFLQDVRNVGVSWERMTPMFNAVEDYVRMWERACELADKWATKDGSAPGC
jgi:choline dehydrogenase-like flavoprotein